MDREADDGGMLKRVNSRYRSQDDVGFFCWGSEICFDLDLEVIVET